MSRWYATGWAGTEAGRTLAQKVRGETQIQKPGSKWRGDKREGMSMKNVDCDRCSVSISSKQWKFFGSCRNCTKQLLQGGYIAP